MGFLAFILSLLVGITNPSLPVFGGSIFPFAFWKPSSVAWCVGANGALSVTDGSTVHIGHVNKDYSSLTLTNGSQLVVDAGSGWVAICVAGNATINTGAAIVGDNAETIYGSTVSKTAPDGTSLSYLYNAIYGGDGGASGFGNPGGGGTGFPSGGGGGAMGTGGDGTNDGGGGAGGACDVGDSTPGAGGIAPGGVGGDAVDNGCQEVLGGVSAAAGGGGARGYHGTSIYLKVTGTLSVSGVVFTANGGDGGNGGAGTSEGVIGGGSNAGGGGGGGGSSGSGGKWVIRYHLGSASSANVSVVTGTPGTGGSPGAGANGGPDGNPGSDGQTGNAGTSDIASF